MFLNTDCPKMSLNIFREKIKQHPIIIHGEEVNEANLVNSIQFDLWVKEVNAAKVIFSANLKIRKEFIHFVKLECDFSFWIPATSINNHYLQCISFSMFDFLRDCFIEYAKEERNNDIRGVTISESSLEDYFLSSSFKETKHLLNTY